MLSENKVDVEANFVRVGDTFKRFVLHQAVLEGLLEKGHVIQEFKNNRAAGDLLTSVVAIKVKMETFEHNLTIH